MIRRAEDRGTMTFRLSGQARKELDRQAAQKHVTPGRLCRMLLERHLASGELRAVLDAIAEVGSRQDALAQGLEEGLSALEEEVAGLRRDFDRALRAAR